METSGDSGVHFSISARQVSSRAIQERLSAHSDTNKVNGNQQMSADAAITCCRGGRHEPDKQQRDLDLQQKPSWYCKVVSKAACRARFNHPPRANSPSRLMCSPRNGCLECRLKRWLSPGLCQFRHTRWQSAFLTIAAAPFASYLCLIPRTCSPCNLLAPASSRSCNRRSCCIHVPACLVGYTVLSFKEEHCVAASRTGPLSDIPSGCFRGVL